MSLATIPSPPMTVRQAAARVGVSEWLIRKMIQRGELRSVRLGRLIRIPEEAVVEKLAEQQNADHS